MTSYKMKKNHDFVFKINGTSSPIPFFTVIVTTYNRELLLKRALDSLVAQTEKDWEAVIVDDGSTDNTYELVLPYLDLYRHITYILIKHGGESWAKNEGIRASKGRFVTFLDSDDAYHSEHLSSRKEILMLNPGVCFLYGGVKIIGNMYVPDRFDQDMKINLNDCVIGGSFFIERNTLLGLKGFGDILMGPDADLFDRAKAVGVKIMVTDLPTYIYHHDTVDSITNKMFYSEKEVISSHT
jgi:glycosyltransferase involved in cell wall biosynthesis